MKVEDFKKIIKANPKAKFKFDLSKTRYIFKEYPEVTGEVTFKGWEEGSWAEVIVHGYPYHYLFVLRSLNLVRRKL